MSIITNANVALCLRQWAHLCILVTAPTSCLRMAVMQTSTKPIPLTVNVVGPTPQVVLTRDQIYHSRHRCCVFTDSGTGIAVR